MFKFTWETPTEENADSTEIWFGRFDAEGDDPDGDVQVTSLGILALLSSNAGREDKATLRAVDWLALARLPLASAGMGGAVWLALRWLPVPAQASASALALLALHVVFGVLVYAGLLAALRSRELGVLRAILRRR